MRTPMFHCVARVARCAILVSLLPLGCVSSCGPYPPLVPLALCSQECAMRRLASPHFCAPYDARVPSSGVLLVCFQYPDGSWQTRGESVSSVTRRGEWRRTDHAPSLAAEREDVRGASACDVLFRTLPRGLPSAAGWSLLCPFATTQLLRGRARKKMGTPPSRATSRPAIRGRSGRRC